MRSSQVAIASNSQCRRRNCPGFDPSILRHIGTWGAADEAVLNIGHNLRLTLGGAPLGIHIIGSGHPVQYLNNMSHGQNLTVAQPKVTWVCCAVILWNSSLRLSIITVVSNCRGDPYIFLLCRYSYQKQLCSFKMLAFLIITLHTNFIFWELCELK